jgi:hypothetical protein
VSAKLLRASVQESAAIVKWLISIGQSSIRVAVEMLDSKFDIFKLDRSLVYKKQAGPQEKKMKNPNTQRRSIGLLVAFAAILTLITVWNLPKTEN